MGILYVKSPIKFDCDYRVEGMDIDTWDYICRCRKFNIDNPNCVECLKGKNDVEMFLGAIQKEYPE